jgi:hypothetical protein
MNLQIHHVISDLDGTTELAIMDAILTGERDPLKLAQLHHLRIRASEETIIKSLVGDYREEHLFTLRQSLKAYRYYRELIQEAGAQMKQMMQRPSSKVAEGEQPPQGSKQATPMFVQNRGQRIVTLLNSRDRPNHARTASRQNTNVKRLFMHRFLVLQL